MKICKNNDYSAICKRFFMSQIKLKHNSVFMRVVRELCCVWDRENFDDVDNCEFSFLFF
jgi:hypothetical protein